MKTIDLTAWNEYQSTIDKIRTEFGEYKDERVGLTRRNRVLYRGQTDANWRLKTTLERVSSRTWTVLDYARAVLHCGPRIESFTDKEWNLTPYTEMEDTIKKNSGMGLPPYIPDYAFWVYMRHHGFPSPLLDWTMSPHIAAFFAFADQSDAAERASIFAFTESKSGIKSGGLGAPQITICGPYVRTHKRHFLQQSWYTVCTSFNKDESEFSSHEAVIAREQEDQDILFKITLPRSDRSKVISNLNESNINYFSLFQTDETLMKTLALERIERIGL